VTRTGVEAPVEALRIVNSGMNVFRCSAHRQTHAEEERGLTWRVSPALTDMQDFAAVGDLTVRTASMFCGVQVICYLTIPGREGNLTDEDWSLADALIERHVEEITHPMYDFAAQQARMITSGFTSTLRLPHVTPSTELVMAQALMTGMPVDGIESLDSALGPGTSSETSPNQD
jgi:hypothetical protein